MLLSYLRASIQAFSSQSTLPAMLRMQMSLVVAVEGVDGQKLPA